MKLVVEEEKDNSCNRNGVIDGQIKKMISSEPSKVSTANGDVHNDDSQSNSESLNGSGDLLIEDPNVRNGSDDTPFQNGNKPDDTRSWSSNSSNFPPPDIDEDLSDEMTLRLSDEEEESENTPESSENKKDNTPHTSSPLLLAEQNTLSAKNQLVAQTQEEDKLLATESNAATATATDGTHKSPELMPAVDTDKDKSVTELREEMEVLLNEEDSDAKAPNNEQNTTIECKEEILSDVDLNSSTSTMNLSFTNEENSSESKNESDNAATLQKEESEKKVTTSDDIIKNKVNENEEVVSVEKSKDSSNTDQIENDELEKDTKEPTVKCNENKEGSTKAVSTENSEEATSTAVEINSDVSNEPKTNVEEAAVVVDLKDNENDQTRDISEPMEIDNNSELNSSTTTTITSSTTTTSTSTASTTTPSMPNDSEPMEIASNDDNNTTIEELTTKNKSSITIKEENDSDSLLIVDSKDNIILIQKHIDTISESDGKVDIKEEEIKGNKEEDSTKSLKRALDTDVNQLDAKKPKITIKPREKREYVPMNSLRDFLSKKEVKTMSREELEEFCVQKMCESINQTSKVGELNRLVKQQEQVIESLRTKYNGLKKQIGDISIVQNKMLQEVRAAKNKDGSANVMPVKITRSVGLQVSLQPTGRVRPVPPSPEQLAAAPIQKRKLQRISLPNKLPSAQTPVTPITPAKPVSATVPKSPNVSSAPTPVSATNPTPNSIPTQTKTVKNILPRNFNNLDTNKDVSSSTNSLLGNYLTNPTPKAPMSNITRKTITPTNAVSSSAASPTAKVIDLTDEDDMSKATSAIPQPPAGIRVVAPHQLNSTSSAVTSQMQRVTYLVSPGQQGQVLLATTSAPTRPGGPRSTIMFKPVQPGKAIKAKENATGTSSNAILGQVPNGQRLNFVRPHSGTGGTVTVLPATSTASIRPGQQIRLQTAGTTVNALRPQMISSTRITPTQRHPAPLPGPPAVQPSQPTWKAMPPKPSLKISRVGDGIVLSWKMLNKDMSLYEDIASYQLYAYQETNAPPSTDMWRKVGDVKALALPMACTLTQFTDGNKYHFAVRAVDVKSRVGPFSQPEQIALP